MKAIIPAIIVAMLMLTVVAAPAADAAEEPYQIYMGVGDTFSYTPTANLSGVTFSVSGTAVTGNGGFLTLDANGVVVGTAMTAGTYSLRITADHEASGQSAVQDVVFTVSSEPGISPISDMSVTVGGTDVSRHYSYHANGSVTVGYVVKQAGEIVTVPWLSHSDGTFSIDASAIPAGTAGTYTATVYFTDPVTGGYVSSSFDIVVSSSFSIVMPSASTFNVGDTVAWTLSTDTGASVVWNADLSGASFLTFDSATGRISGTASSAGTYSVTVSASDGSLTQSATWRFTVAATQGGGGGGGTDELGDSTGTVTKGASDLEVVLHNTTVGSSRCVWGMGDGNAVDQPTSDDVAYTYAATGTYTVAQTAYSSDGRAFGVHYILYTVGGMIVPEVPDTDDGKTTNKDQGLWIAPIVVGLLMLAAYAVAAKIFGMNPKLLLIASPVLIALGIAMRILGV